MYRFLLRPRWLLFHAVVIAAIVAMISLGFWQLDRLSQRQAFNRQVIERSERDPLALGSVLADIDAGRLTPDGAEWLPVTASGSYLPGQIVEFNQSQGGRAGENMLAALTLDGTTTTVVVNRGFVPLGFDRPAAPTGDVAVTGLVRTSEVRRRGGLTDTTDGPLTEVRRIDIDAIAPQLPGDVAPVYVQLVTSDPEVVAGDPEPIVRPELDDGPHLSYAIQWFVFSVCVAIGWVLAVRRSLAARRRPPAPPVDDGGPPLTDGTDERTPVGSH